MNASTLYNFLYFWIDLILNTELSLGIPIIQEYQDAPAPDERYIAIDSSPDRTTIGRAYRTEPINDPGPEEGLVNIVNDDELMLELREVNGTGDLLRVLTASIERASVQLLFAENKITYFGDEGVKIINRTNDNKWIKEAVVEIRLGVGEGIETFEDSWIDTVEYSNNFEH